jgi:hypothetical protein
MHRGISWTFISSIILFFFMGISFGQNSIEPGYFDAPIKHEIRLAGTFGELRTNHFHMGIDIKSSKGVSGDSIFAVADGFVSRIKVQSGGYGNGLYLDHPNGYTSVYGHLHSYRKDIADWIRGKQYENESFELDVYPDSSEFKIQKGDFIGKMGSSGYSFGPHLHFEIRETRSEIPINPLLCGYTIKDTREPVIHSVSVYHLNDKLEKLDQEIFYLNSKNGSKVLKDTIEIGAWRIGFGVSSYDPMDNIGNKNGIYNMSLKVDGVKVHQTKMDSISFEETRGLNGLIDYSYFKNNRRRYQRCYVLPGLELRVCENSEGSVVELYESKAREIELSLEDFSGNINTLHFWVKRKDINKDIPNAVYNYILPYNEDNVILRENIKLFFEKGSLYENLYLHFQSSKESSANQLSDVYHIHDNSTPLNTPIELYIKPSTTLDSSLLEKVCLVNCTQSNKYVNWGGKWVKEWFSSTTEELGSYFLYVDTIPPSIKIKSFRTNMQGWRNIQFVVKDNLVSRGTAKDLDIKARIDGQWVLMEYDLKSNTITHWFQNELSAGSHAFELKVRDDRGNEAVFSQTFTY